MLHTLSFRRGSEAKHLGVLMPRCFASLRVTPCGSDRAKWYQYPGWWHTYDDKASYPIGLL